MIPEMMIDTFFANAENFCGFLDKLNSFTTKQCRQLLIKLTEIYLDAIALQSSDFDTDYNEDTAVDRLYVNFGQYDIYNEIYNPYNDDQVVCGSLQDDFADIYNDLKIGIILYKQGLKNDAYFQWWWSFNNHWSYHAVDALRALNAIYIEECSKMQ